ncbi:cAMP-specific 3',5'-cyclic phosphodiesterase 4A [Blyttiomyces sp. JEL0837]|nr:cAMP-specific 3',5'-cyclic phosphodiesterase 4A [Blyttiomyces sp. JEL0837]
MSNKRDSLSHFISPANSNWELSSKGRGLWSGRKSRTVSHDNGEDGDAGPDIEGGPSGGNKKMDAYKKRLGKFLEKMNVRGESADGTEDGGGGRKNSEIRFARAELTHVISAVDMVDNSVIQSEMMDEGGPTIGAKPGTSSGLEGYDGAIKSLPNVNDARPGTSAGANLIGADGSIVPLEQRFPGFLWLQEFKDTKREREYERWYWKRNQKSWQRGLWLIFGGSLVYYGQFFALSSISARSYSSRLALDPQASCGCYTFCSSTYNYSVDILFWILGNVAPIIACLLVAKYAPTKITSRFVHIFSGLLCTTLSMVNMVGRNYVMDKTGDPWFRGISSLFLVICPMLLKMSPITTFISGSSSMIIYAALFLSLVDQNNSGLSGARQYDREAVEIVVILIIIGMYGFSVVVTSQFEREERRAFMINLGLVRNNDKLRLQLNHLRQSFNHKITHMDSPLEKALLTLKSILANPNIDLTIHSQIDTVIAWLSASEKIFTPTFDRQPQEDGSMNLNDEQEAWLMDLLPTQQLKVERRRGRGTMSARRQSDHSRLTVNPNALLSGSSMSPSDREDVQTINGNRPLGSRIPSATSISTITLGKDVMGSTEITTIEPLTGSSTRSKNGAEISGESKSKIQALLADVTQWNWNIFDFEDLTPKPLYTLALYIFHKAGFMWRFNIPMDKLRHFLMRIEMGYHPDVPYHNATHACDVLHAVNFFVNTEAMNGKLADLEIMAALTAAIIHDYDHPGYNNQHLIAIRDPKALMYNDRSVLENHHVSTSWNVLTKEDCNFLINLDKEEYTIVREQCVDMVLSTDLASHFANLSAFKNKVMAAGTFDLGNKDDRILFWRMVIKCADVSNMSKTWKIYDKWCNRIMTEFFRQGDQEKKLGLPVSPFMDRETVSVPNVQLSFSDYICMPLYEAIMPVLQVPRLIETLLANRETLVKMKEEEKRTTLLIAS